MDRTGEKPSGNGRRPERSAHCCRWGDIRTQPRGPGRAIARVGNQARRGDVELFGRTVKHRLGRADLCLTNSRRRLYVHGHRGLEIDKVVVGIGVDSGSVGRSRVASDWIGRRDRLRLDRRRPAESCIVENPKDIRPAVLSQRIARASWLSRHIVGRRARVTNVVMGVAEELIGFRIGAIIAVSAGMIVLLVFAAVGTALILWARERSGSDLDLRRRAWTPTDRGADARISAASGETPQRAALLLASPRGLCLTRT